MNKKMKTLSNENARLFGRQPKPEMLESLVESQLDFEDHSLREMFSENGYLYFNKFFDNESIKALRSRIFSYLIEVDEVREVADKFIYTGLSNRREKIKDLGKFWRNISEDWLLRRLTHSRSLHELCDRILNCRSIAQDYLFLRIYNVGRQTLTHSDSGFFTRKTPNVITVWISLGETPLEMGPIFLLENSHKNEKIIEDLKNFDVAKDKKRKASWDQNPIDIAEMLSCKILTQNMSVGDIVVFNMNILHGSFDNINYEGQTRLTCDVRYQPFSDPRDPRYFGPFPSGTTGKGYGELVGAIPLDEKWHIR